MKHPLIQPETAKLCRNCASPLVGEFCHNCGQEHSSAILPLGEVIEDVIGEYITFDSKIFRSIKPLLFKPGFLTTEYIAGKRASYLLPSRMYLVVAVIFFFLAGRYDPVTLEKNYENAEAEIATVMKEKNLSRVEVEVRFDNAISSVLATGVLSMIPIFTLFLKLLFPKRFITEHLVFSFHFFSFVLLCLIPGLFYEPLNVMLLVVIGIYLTIALRRNYQISWLRTIFSGVSAFLVWIMLIAFLFMVALRVYGFSSL